MISRTALFACVLSLASFALAGCTTETEASSSEQELTQADGVAVPFDQMRREQTAAPSIATQDGVRGDAIVMPGSSPAKDFEDANLDLAQQRPIVDGVVREQASAPSLATPDEIRGEAIVMPGSSPATDFEDANLDLAQQRPFVFVDGVVREAPLH